MPLEPTLQPYPGCEVPQMYHIFACAHGEDWYNGDMVDAQYVSVESNHILFFPFVMFTNYNKDIDKNSNVDCALNSRDACPSTKKSKLASVLSFVWQ